MKDKRVIRQVLTIYLVCFVARIFEYFVLRTDQTILGEAFIHKLFGIIVICLVVRRSGEILSDMGFEKNIKKISTHLLTVLTNGAIT